ncbi:MAG: RNA polymerase sigma factor [Caulobacteraceae bacterium]|nr:RNA polymerase sigma factor [Caulobacteraceae bacterium]
MTAFATEADLVAKARAGSDEAFGRLVDLNQQAVRAFLRRLCGDPAEADDLAQETFLTAWSTLGRLRDQVKVRTWLCGIAFRKAQTAMRSRSRAARRDRQWLDTRDTVFAPGGDDRALVERAMAELAIDQRAAVALCLAGDWSHSEAAEALGVPVGTVKSHVARGRAKLLELLGARS